MNQRLDPAALKKFQQILPQPRHYWLGLLTTDQLRTVMGETVLLFEGPRNVFFTDWEPDANWGHDCSYWIEREAGFVRANQEWPPTDRIEMIEVPSTTCTNGG